MQLIEKSLEWALKHLRRFYSSDFFPEPFEFEAIETQWSTVKEHLLRQDISRYVPQAPLRYLAPKANGTFRVVHQLDPLDSLIYTALVHSIAADVEGLRIPERERIVCSYRIAPDINGSFFSQTYDGWKIFTEKSNELVEKYRGGVVVVTDLVDFYNQIYTHRIQNVISEIGKTGCDQVGSAIGSFVEALNTQTSRGIPVGPTASVILSEAILGDIDQKILRSTRDFARYSDDFRIFFRNYESARVFLHDLTEYIHDNHRLVMSAEKTAILSVDQFSERLRADDATREQQKLEENRKKLAVQKYMEELLAESGPYDDPAELFDREEYLKVLQRLSDSDQFKAASVSYREIMKSELKSAAPDYLLLRRIIRNAGTYRIRSIFDDVLSNFERLLPVVREVGIYLTKVITKEIAGKYTAQFASLANTDAARLPFVNTWLAHIFANGAFGSTEISKEFLSIASIRDQAQIALRRNDRAWVKTYKNGIDTLGPWDKRAVLFASKVLADDERRSWLRIAKSRGDVLEQVLADHLLAG
jgi:hypothetical protein